MPERRLQRRSGACPKSSTSPPVSIQVQRLTEVPVAAAQPAAALAQPAAALALAAAAFAVTAAALAFAAAIVAAQR